MEKNGNGAFGALLLGFIGGAFLTLCGVSRGFDEEYRRGYEKAKSEDRIASLESELEKVKGTEVEEEAEEA